MLHVIPAVAPSYGGPSQAVLEMVRSLISHGIGAEIVTTDADGRRNLKVLWGKKILYQGAPVYFFPRTLRAEYKFSWPLTQWLRRNIQNYDLLHLHSIFCYPTAIAAHYARKFRTPYILRPAGMLEDWSLNQKSFRKRLYLNLIENKTLGSAAALHYTSGEEKRVSERLAFSRRGVVVPLGIDLDLQSQKVERGTFKRKYAIPPGKKLIVFLSRLHPKKGLEFLADALSKLHFLRDDFIFVIAGKGEARYESSLKRRVRERGLQSETLFTGFLEGKEKQALLRDADLFVLPSHQENFGFAAVEAMAEGVPVIVSDRIDLAAEIKEFGAGVTVPREIGPLTAAIHDLLNDEQKRNRMGEKGRDMVLKKFDRRKMAENLLALYQDILNGSDRPL